MTNPVLGLENVTVNKSGNNHGPLELKFYWRACARARVSTGENESNSSLGNEVFQVYQKCYICVCLPIILEMLLRKIREGEA